MTWYEQKIHEVLPNTPRKGAVKKMINKHAERCNSIKDSCAFMEQKVSYIFRETERVIWEGKLFYCSSECTLYKFAFFTRCSLKYTYTFLWVITGNCCYSSILFLSPSHFLRLSIIIWDGCCHHFEHQASFDFEGQGFWARVIKISHRFSFFNPSLKMTPVISSPLRKYH